MSWSWVPPREGEGGPSPALRRAVTVLGVLFTAVIALSYVVSAQDRATRACAIDAPAGAEVSAEWQWWPPGHACVYDQETTQV
ncbi:hypothetical protein [Paraoerskovia marina]|uniref:Uncharacterized protein n=1 Tax=Paraoerskovia marina TaxID=545619 RepID=A0A1H1TKY1_9CELL|nr:hypothetical protein [Paraoerskovia marina]SDS60731.1 hypothetical protein SAMN04489860_1930 [Paraoerskovia marina]